MAAAIPLFLPDAALSVLGREFNPVLPGPPPRLLATWASLDRLLPASVSAVIFAAFILLSFIDIVA